MKSKTKLSVKNENVAGTKCRRVWIVVLAGVIGVVIGWGAGAYFSRHSFVFSEMECLDGAAPDKNGCCPGEVYTDMGDQGNNCCPEAGGDCFPPMR